MIPWLLGGPPSLGHVASRPVVALIALLSACTGSGVDSGTAPEWQIHAEPAAEALLPWTCGSFETPYGTLDCEEALALYPSYAASCLHFTPQHVCSCEGCRFVVGASCDDCTYAYWTATCDESGAVACRCVCKVK